MDRRTFLGGATSASALGMSSLGSSMTTQGREVQRQASGKFSGDRLKVLLGPQSDQQMADLSAETPDVDLIVCPDQRTAAKHMPTAHGTYGIYSPELFQTADNLRWIQFPSAGVERICSNPEVVNSDVILTNMQGVFGPAIADTAMGYLIGLLRGLDGYIQTQSEQTWQRPARTQFRELQGLRMVIVGLGGIGTNLARRAHGFGMSVQATDPKVINCPNYVDSLHKPEELDNLLSEADVLASCAPLTPITERMFTAKRFAKLPRGAIFLNVSRGKLVDTEALVDALNSGQISGAGLDVTDPEPLPTGHPLWSQHTIITPHMSGRCQGSIDRAFHLFRENLGRFARGEMLLNQVDKKLGY